METEQGSVNRWSSPQAYGFATVCLTVGIVCGYLIHGPVKPVELPVSQEQTAAPQPEGLRQAPATMPTPDQMKHMADKKADPLLAKLKTDPNDPALLAEIGRTYLYAHQFEEAAAYFEKSAAIKADPKTLTTLGGIYHFEGADDKALETWDRALKLDPNYADALVNVGLVKIQSGADPQGAIDAWTRMVKANPNHPQRAKVEEMIASAKKQLNPK